MPRKTLIFSFLLIVSLACSGRTFAGEAASRDYLADLGSQLCRGVANILTSPLEIPCTIGDDMTARPETGFFTGLGKGTLFMLRRILVGVSELATFMMPAESTLPPVCKVNSNKP